MYPFLKSLKNFVNPASRFENFLPAVTLTESSIFAISKIIVALPSISEFSEKFFARFEKSE